MKNINKLIFLVFEISNINSLNIGVLFIIIYLMLKIIYN